MKETFKASLRLRLDELIVSTDLVTYAVKHLPEGPIRVKIPPIIPAGEHSSHCEAPRGEIFYYVKSTGGRTPDRVKSRQPTMANLPTALEMLKGQTIADVPIVLTAIDPCFGCMDRMSFLDTETNKTLDMVRRATATVRYQILQTTEDVKLLLQIFEALVFPGVLFTIGVGFLFDWLDRKTAARMQGRIGPKIAGPSGILQPFADFLKLLFKEEIIPSHADRTIFLFAPALILPRTLTFDALHSNSCTESHSWL